VGRKRKLSEEEELEMQRAYETRTVSLRQLAATYGYYNESSVRKVFERRGVKPNPPFKTLGRTGRKSKYGD
jgi:transposase